MSRMLRRATLASLLALVMAAPVLAQDDASTPSPVEPGAWQVATVSGGPVPGFRAIVPWDGGFAALGWPANAAMEDQSRDVPVWLSEDGSEWQASEYPIRLPSNRGMATHLVAVDGELMAFGSAGQRLFVWASEDGQRWQRSALRAVGLPKGYGVQVADAAAAGGRVVVSGLYGMAGDNPWFGRGWASDDGQDWRSSPTDDPVFGLGAGPEGFIGTVWGRVCKATRAVPVRSADGLDWRPLRRPGRTCDLQAVAYDEHSDRYFATTFKTPRGAVLRSDGGEWQEVLELDPEFAGTPLTMVPRALHVRDGVIAVVGEGDRIDAEDNEISHPFVAISDDGTDWHLSVGWPDEDASHRASAIGHSRLVVAAGGQVWYADLADLGVETAIADEATSETAVSADEQAKPIGKELQRIIRARRSFGFETDPDIVRAIRRDPYQPDSRQYGFPMTEAEAQDLLARSGWSGRASFIRPWLRKQDGFGGIWIDQRDGGAIAIAFTKADPEVIREIDQRFAPFDGPTPLEARHRAALVRGAPGCLPAGPTGQSGN